MIEKSILITGATSGIGLAAAETLKGRGWRVLATARKPEDVERLRIEEGLEVIPLELADPASVAACADEALRLTGGKLTALYNNGAYGQVGAIEDLSSEVLRHQFEVNFFAPHELVRRILPAMRANGGGRIVQCSSVLGLMAAPYRGGYCASKFALEALTDSLRLELADEPRIKVSLIEPGPIRTKFVATALARFDHRHGAFGSQGDVSEAPRYDGGRRARTVQAGAVRGGVQAHPRVGECVAAGAVLRDDADACGGVFKAGAADKHAGPVRGKELRGSFGLTRLFLAALGPLRARCLACDNGLSQGNVGIGTTAPV
jgi:NAD(P)-dependent dehydrogenase (short-subunit alcohol dehydrogenase family)